MAKHFVINPEKEKVDKSGILEAEIHRKAIHFAAKDARDKSNEEQLKRKEGLKNVFGRVVVKVNLEGKNSHRFNDGTEIRLARGFDNFNKRETEPTNAIVISSDYIPEGSEILISHKALHDSNKIFDYVSNPSEQNDIRYYSIPEADCFAWVDGSGLFQPLKGFAFGLRVFEPHNGFLVGIEPKAIKDVLYVTTGEFKGYVVHTLKACDYEIVFQNHNGREDRIIRFRHFEDEDNEREEVICINHEMTSKVISGELMVGLNAKEASVVVLQN